jgi:hypothetical protein
MLIPHPHLIKVLLKFSEVIFGKEKPSEDTKGGSDQKTDDENTTGTKN